MSSNVYMNSAKIDRNDTVQRTSNESNDLIDCVINKSSVTKRSMQMVTSAV